MSCRCPIIKPKPERAVVKPCENCDTCAPADSTVRLCAFTVPTLEEGRYYKNSFVYVEEENTTYYISDDRSEIPFGSRPYYIDDFDPDAPGPAYKKALIYDLKNKALYIYDANGNMLRVPLEAEVRLVAGKGIVITNNDGEYTIATDGTFATHEDLEREIGIEASERTAADTNLQSQIDTIVNSSDVKDVVGTKAELDAYDKSKLGDNDIVKVLQDETEDGATTYYRYSTATQSFTLVGEIGPYYTKGEMDEKLQTGVVTGFNGVTYGASNYAIKYNLGKVGSNSSVIREFSLSYADRTGAGPLSKASYVKFDDAANQTETNRHDISEALGQIAALDADKLGIENLLEGAGVTITKEGEGRETKLTISAEGGGGDAIKLLTAADYNYPVDSPTSINPYYLPQGWYQVKYGTTVRGASEVRAAVANQEVFLITRNQNNAVRVYVFGDNSRGTTGAETYQMFMLSGATSISTRRNAVLSQDVVDNLNSDSTNYPLSANMGRELKAMIDAIPSGGGDGAYVPTEKDYNWNSVTRDTTEPYDSVALWRLPAGVYRIGDVPVYTDRTTTTSTGNVWLVGKSTPYGTPLITTAASSDVVGSGSAILYGQFKTTAAGGGSGLSTNIYAPVDSLGSASKQIPLSANMGKQLNDRLTILEQGGGSGIEVVQDVGDSETAVMSQKAASSLIYKNPNSTTPEIVIGKEGSTATGTRSVVVGNDSSARNARAVAIGYYANATHSDSIALGPGTKTTKNGQLSVEKSGTLYGYNGTPYTLISGVHDPEEDHDAATKGYVDTAVAGVGVPNLPNSKLALSGGTYSLTGGTPVTVLEGSAGLRGAFGTPGNYLVIVTIKKITVTNGGGDGINLYLNQSVNDAVYLGDSYRSQITLIGQIYQATEGPINIKVNAVNNKAAENSTVVISDTDPFKGANVTIIRLSS